MEYTPCASEIIPEDSILARELNVLEKEITTLSEEILKLNDRLKYATSPSSPSPAREKACGEEKQLCLYANRVHGFVLTIAVSVNELKDITKRLQV